MWNNFGNQGSVVHGLKKLKLMHLLGVLKLGTVSARFNESALPNMNVEPLNPYA
jgi:hypothetical protein